MVVVVVVRWGVDSAVITIRINSRVTVQSASINLINTRGVGWSGYNGEQKLSER